MASHFRTDSSPAWVHIAAAISVALLYGTVMYGLWHLPSVLWGMYANIDGHWAAWNARSIMRWGEPFDFSPFNPLAGTGSIFLPSLPWTNPAAMALALPGPREIGYAVSYTVYFFELLVANYLLFRVLGATRWTAFLASQAFIVILFPPTTPAFNALPWYSLAPINAHLLALCNLALAVLLRIGRNDTRTDIALAVALAVLAFLAFASAPVTILTYVPAYGLLAISTLLCRRAGRRELFWKTGAVAAVAGLFLALGIVDYIRATGAVSSRIASLPPFMHRGLEHLSVAYWSRLFSEYDVCAAPAYRYLACYRTPMGWVLFAGLAGSIIAIWQRTPLRPVGWFVLCFVPLAHFFHLAGYDFVFGALHAIGPAFLLWAAYPFCILMVVAGVTTLAQRIRLRPAGTSAAVTASFLVAPIAAILIWKHFVSPYQPPLPGGRLEALALPRSNLRQPPRGPIMAKLRDEAAIGIGSGFRGYTGTYFGDPRGWMSGQIAMPQDRRTLDFYPRSRLYLDHAFGNRFQEMDLWDAGIPSFEEYGQWITIFMWTTAARIFTPLGARLHPSFLRIHRLDLPAMRRLGLRFLITDLEIDEPGTTLIEREQSRAAPGPMYLYRIDGPEIGSGAIMRADVVATFDEALARLPGLRDSEITVFEPVAAPLAAPLEPEFRYRSDGFSVTARASRPSGIVLPIQFSRCLVVAAHGPGHRASSVRLLRANAVQTLILFDGDIDMRIRFDFGPLDPSCRLRDADDVRALGIERRPH